MVGRYVRDIEHSITSGCGPVVRRYVRDIEAGGSNSLTPTNLLAMIRKSITNSYCLDGETGERGTIPGTRTGGDDSRTVFTGFGQDGEWG